MIVLQLNNSSIKGVKSMFVVPKKKFKDAHDRNKLKRRMREAYRAQKAEFYSTLKAESSYYIVGFIYYGNKTEDFEVITKSLRKLLTAPLP